MGVVSLRSIKTKLILIMLIMTSVALSILGGLSYWGSRNMLLSDTEENLISLADAHAKEIGLWLDIRKAEINLLSNNPVILNSSPEEIINYLTNELKNNSVYQFFFITDEKGNATNTIRIPLNVADRDYFVNAIQKGHVIVSNPIISKTDGKKLVMVVAPRKKDGNIIGTVGGAVAIDDLIARVMDIKVGKTGYGFVKQGDGLTIIHPDDGIMMKYNELNDVNADQQLKNLTEEMIKGNKGIKQHDFNGVSKYLAYAPIKGMNWSFGISVPINEVTIKLNLLLKSWIFMMLIILLLAGIISYIFANRLAKPILALNMYANRIAGGDLSDTDIYIASSDEIGQLTNAFKVMVGNLKNIIQQVMKTALQVSTAAEELNASAEQVAQSTNQVAASVTNIADGALEQSNKVFEIGTSAKQLTDNVELLSAGDIKIQLIVKETASETENGQAAVNNVIEQMQKISNETLRVQKTINHLLDSSKQIGDIVNLISSIASQTNLLALNAAIEAARAGEHGRGFAVVADEVRKLAEQSQDAAKEISSLIYQNNENIKQAVAAMTMGITGVSEGTDVVNVAGDQFKKIAKLIKSLAEQYSLSSVQVQDTSVNSTAIVERINIIGSISHKLATETQTISGATQEQSAAMQQIAASTQSLSKLAQEMQQQINQFKTA